MFSDIDSTFRTVKRILFVFSQEIVQSVFCPFIWMAETFYVVCAVKIAWFHHLSFWTHDNVFDDFIFHFPFFISWQLVFLKVLFSNWSWSHCLTWFWITIIETFINQDIFRWILPIECPLVSFRVIERGFLFWVVRAFILTFYHLTILNDWNIV